MTQISKYPTSKNVSDRVFELFTKTLIEVRNESEAENLISDFFTPTEKIYALLNDAVVSVLSVPSTLERGKGSWSYLKREAVKSRKKHKKAF